MGPARLAWENSGRCVLCCDQLQDIELLQEDKPSRPKFPQPGLAFPGPLSSRSQVTVHTARAGTRHRENQETLTRTERRESGGMNGAGEAGRCRPRCFLLIQESSSPPASCHRSFLFTFPFERGPPLEGHRLPAAWRGKTTSNVWSLQNI